MRTSNTKTPAELLRVDDHVRAVERGPIGRVAAVGGGWTIVRYHYRHSGGQMAYRHGQDGLYREADG